MGLYKLIMWLFSEYKHTGHHSICILTFGSEVDNRTPTVVHIYTCILRVTEWNI